MLIVSDCHYFSYAIQFMVKKDVFRDCSDVAIVDVRQFLSPSAMLKKIITISECPGVRHYVLVSDASVHTRIMDVRDLVIDLNLPLPLFGQKLRAMMSKKITFCQYALKIVSACGDNIVSPRKSLTKKESEIREMICLNLSVVSIAEKLGLSAKTIYSHLDNIKRKYQVNSLRMLYMRIQEDKSSYHHHRMSSNAILRQPNQCQ